ncbi:FAD-dependent oxidoreductase [Aliikangiella maris]|uniref:NAD(P)/FAD-dependent oxidoreductase n=2 Tax=Aliikangiella maris TaxID=3162458 RepID=A0ABV3MR66_9GAMM
MKNNLPIEFFEMIIIGAGPSGIAAALIACQHYSSVLLIDESAQAGGQVFRAPSPALRINKPSSDLIHANQLRQQLASSSVITWFNHRVWQVESVNAHFIVSSYSANHQLKNSESTSQSPNKLFFARAPQLIVASGAQEKIFPVPGWTKPGVMGLAAATVLLKSEKILPGQNIVVAGTGPLLLLVANEIINAGGKITAIVDLNSPWQWLKSIKSVFRNLKNGLKGIRWIIKIYRQRIPFFHRHTLIEINGKDSVNQVILAPVNRNWQADFKQPKLIKADTVCLGHGLLPAIEIPQLLNVKHYFNVNFNSWCPQTDSAQRTNIKNLYLCGDGCGIQGADAAPLSGKIAALSALLDAKKINLDNYLQQYTPLKKKLDSISQFTAAMNRLTAFKQGLLSLLKPDTIICRCENIDTQTIQAAIAAGNTTLNSLKAATRCGMGACGSRFCRETISYLIANQTQKPRTAIKPASCRPPIRPIPIQAVVDNFNYRDLPIPEPAPE